MGHMFGYGFGYQNAWWWMLGFGLIRILLIVGVIIFVVKMVNKNRQGHATYQPSIRAEEILKERYAVGEISEEEYEKKLKHLRS